MKLYRQKVRHLIHATLIATGFALACCGQSPEFERLHQDFDEWCEDYRALHGEMGQAVGGMQKKVGSMKQTVRDMRGAVEGLKQNQRDLKDWLERYSESQKRVELQNARQPDKNKWPYCRVYSIDGGVGSGTLVGAGDSKGLIITNAHVLGTGRSATCTFVNGERCYCRVIDMDKDKDLAALECSLPTGVDPIVIGDLDNATKLQVSGWGSNGVLRTPQGTLINSSLFTSGGGVRVYETTAPSRKGDSGGSVINAETGNMVGVRWGSDPENGNATQFTGSRDLKSFIRDLTQWSCANGQCRRIRQPGREYRIVRPSPPQSPRRSQPVQPNPKPCNCGPKWDSLEATIAELRAEIEALRNSCSTEYDARLQKLEYKIDSVASGPAGPQGPPGPRGPEGPSPDMTAVNEAIGNLNHAIQDLQHKQEKPFHIRARQGNLVTPYAPVVDGDYVTIDLEKLQ